MHHEHSHSTEEKINYNKRFCLGILLNAILVVAQIFYGIQSNSVALISDGLHNASDVLALVIAWGGFYISSLKPSERFTYGFKNTTIIAAFINAVLLFIVVGGITWEAIIRLNTPEHINTQTVTIVASIGLIINMLTAIMFMTGKQDINIRGAFLHMASDAGVSLGVIIGSIAIVFTGWVLIDPLLSIVISILIIVSTWSLFRESINLILHAVPEHINTEEVRNFLLNLPHVASVHDLHIWALSTSETALSVHLVRTITVSEQDFLQNLLQQLEKQFHIQHATIQVENTTLPAECALSCDNIKKEKSSDPVSGI